MANGTGTTTGPYTIFAGQTLSLNDPAVWSGASEKVQVQNNTGYNIYLQTAGAGYNIQPFTASTIPCAGGQTIVGVVSSTQNIQSGLLTAVWLLPGQNAPIQDGPLTVYPVSSHILGVQYGSPVTLTGFNSNDAFVNIGFQYQFPSPSTTYLWLVGNISGQYISTSAINYPSGTVGYLTGAAAFSIAAVNNTQFAIWYGTISAPTGYVNSTSSSYPYTFLSGSVTATAHN